MKMLVPLIITFLLTYCSSHKALKNVDENASAVYSFEEVWNAVYKTSLHYPLKDFSKEDGTVESEWINMDDFSRYRFFISIEGSQIQVSPTQETTSAGFQPTIDVQYQTRKSRDSSWHWSSPPLDKAENLKNTIHEYLQKTRAA